MKRVIAMFRSSPILATLFLVAALSIGGTGTTPAADWPVKQVELINPFGAGGAADIQARKLAEIISRDLGQPMIVRNVLGAGGAIAYNEVNRSKPDGHTLIWYSGAINTLAARKQIAFDYTAFEPIAGIGSETVSIAVAKNAPGRTSGVHRPLQGQPRQGHDGELRDGSVTHMVPWPWPPRPASRSSMSPSAKVWRWRR